MFLFILTGEQVAIRQAVKGQFTRITKPYSI